MAQAIMADSFDEKKRGQAFALYALVTVLAPSIGPSAVGRSGRSAPAANSLNKFAVLGIQRAELRQHIRFGKRLEGPVVEVVQAIDLERVIGAGNLQLRRGRIAVAGAGGWRY